MRLDAGSRFASCPSFALIALCYALALLAEVYSRLDELQQVIETSRAQRDAALHSLAYRLRDWRTHVRKRAAMYSVRRLWNSDVAGHS